MFAGLLYPDLVSGTARLTGTNTLKPIITRADGRLLAIRVAEGQSVQKHEWLATLESTANAADVMQLSAQLDSIRVLVANQQTEAILPYFPGNGKAMLAGGNPQLGELQPAYQAYVQAFIAFKDYLGNGFYLRKKAMLLQDMEQLIKMQMALVNQQKLLGKDIDLSQQNFAANQQLYQQKVIAAFEIRNEESKLIGKQLSMPQTTAAIIANQSQQLDKRKEIAALENEIEVQKNSFIQALQTLQSLVQAWQYKYLLQAPVAGQFSLAGFFQEGQELKAGQTIFYVQPPNSSYYVEMLIPQYNFGKVKVGQQVLLKMTAYPYEQYGQLVGSIAHINQSPTDSGYLAKVTLPNGLRTNYNKPLLFREGLQASADIVTADMRLLERFYFSFSKQLSR